MSYKIVSYALMKHINKDYEISVPPSASLGGTKPSPDHGATEWQLLLRGNHMPDIYCGLASRIAPERSGRVK